MIPKAQATKEKRDKLDFIKIKSLCVSEDIIRKWNNNPQNERNDLQIISLIKDLYTEYVKNTYNLIMKRLPK